MKNTFLLLFAFVLSGLNATAQQGMGVGNSNPQEMLDVTGAIKIGTTTTTNAGTIRWNGTNFQGYDGTQWVNLDGAGGADSDWTVAGNDQYSAVSGNVGIGLTNPTSPMHIKRDQNSQTSLVIENDDTGANSAERISFNNEDGSVAGIAVYDDNSGAYPSQMRIFNNRPSSSVHLINSGNPSNNSNLSLIDGGNVGIGTLTPGAKLEVNGQVKITGGAPGANKVLTSDAAGLGSWVDPNTLVSADSDWTVSGINQYSAVSGNVGIGTTTPNYKLDVSGSARFNNGSFVNNGAASNPSISFSSDPNTGIYAPSADNLGFVTGGSEGFRVDENGNVGMGPVNPDAKLDLVGSFRYTDGNQGVNKVLRSDGSGFATWVDPATLISNDGDWTVSGNNQYSAVSDNVGIGTTTPDAKLEVYNPGGATLMKITKDGSQNSALFFVNGNNNTQGTTLTLNSAEHFIVQNNIADKDIFFNINDGGTATDVLFIDGGESRVGVLNTAPAYELDVSGDISIDNSLVHNDDDNTFLSFTPDRIQLFAGSGSSPRIDIQSSVSEVAVNEAGLQWDFRVEGDTDPDLLFVDGSADNVGIGTNAPTAKLEVEGQVKITGGAPGANKVLTSDAAGLGTWVDPNSLVSGDNLGNHIATENIRLSGFWISNDGGNEGIRVDNAGRVGIGNATPALPFEVYSTTDQMARFRGDDHAVVRIDGTTGSEKSLSFRNATTGVEEWKVGMDNFNPGGSTSDFIVKQTNNALAEFTIQASGGNVGIGVAAPGAKLEVAGQVKITGGTPGANKVLTSDATGLATWVDPNTLVSNDGDWTVSGNDQYSALSGNVGVGTSSPNSKLDVVGGVHSWNTGFGMSSFTDGARNFANFSGDNHAGTLVGQNMYSNGGTLKAAQTHATLAGSGIFIPGNAQTNQGAILFYTNPPAATTAGSNLGGLRMALTTSGRLGIGTTNPIAPLHVENSNDATYGNFTFYALNQYTNTPNNPTSCCGGTVNNVAIHANGRVMASEFDAFSDARIKNVISVSNSEEDLKKLLGIEITDYRMKDAAKDVKQYKKVIAQQVEDVYPLAVSTITDVIPNIYSLATIENGFVSLKADVKTGDRIKLILDSGTEMVTVTSVEENGFKIDSELNEQAFVYGTEVDDFRTVDYEAISMLNVSATQELFKLISQLQSSNKELEQKLSDYSSLKADVEILKEALGIDLQSSK